PTRSQVPATRTAAAGRSSAWAGARPASCSSGRGSAPPRPPTSTRARRGGAGRGGVPFAQRGPNAASLPDTLSSVAGCVDVDAGLAHQIAASPRDWYVNIHTADFPAGAIRGRLHRARHLDLDLPHQLRAELSGANEVPPADPD